MTTYLEAFATYTRMCTAMSKDLHPNRKGEQEVKARQIHKRSKSLHKAGSSLSPLV
jgi:hypothetical protein